MLDVCSEALVVEHAEIKWESIHDPLLCILHKLSILLNDDFIEESDLLPEQVLIEMDLISSSTLLFLLVVLLLLRGLVVILWLALAVDEEFRIRLQHSALVIIRWEIIERREAYANILVIGVVLVKVEGIEES